MGVVSIGFTNIPGHCTSCERKDLPNAPGFGYVLVSHVDHVGWPCPGTGWTKSLASVTQTFGEATILLWQYVRLDDDTLWSL